MKAKKRLAVLLLFIIIGAAFFLHVSARIKDSQYTSGCSNHFWLHVAALTALNKECPDLILPSESDTRRALYKIYPKSPFIQSAEWLYTHGSACPESKLRDGSIGYVYIGDGLNLSDVIQKDILILFCPAENHQGYAQLCHGFSIDDGRNGCKDNAAMIKKLELAIERGKNGEVNYSKRAMKVLREQLEKRIGFEKIRNPRGATK